jgi:hypothetical protein
MHIKDNLMRFPAGRDFPFFQHPADDRLRHRMRSPGVLARPAVVQMILGECRELHPKLIRPYFCQYLLNSLFFNVKPLTNGPAR